MSDVPGVSEASGQHGGAGTHAAAGGRVPHGRRRRPAAEGPGTPGAQDGQLGTDTGTSVPPIENDWSHILYL